MNPARVILAAPLIWLSGFTPVAYHIAAFWNATRHGFRTSRESNILLVFILFYFFSICMSAFGHGDAERVIASLYTWTFWGMGWFIIVGSHSIDARKLSRASRVTAYVVLLITLICTLFIFDQPTIYPSFLKLTIPNLNFPPVLENQLRLEIVNIDRSVFDTHVLRPGILATYTMSHAPTMFLLMVLSAPKSRSIIIVSFHFFVFSVFILSTIFIARTRSAMIAIAVYLAIILFSFVLRRLGAFRQRILILFFIILLLSFIISSSGFLFYIYEYFYNVRADSSVGRASLYSFGFFQTLENSPLFGFGVKHQYDLLSSHGGFHSTYVNIFYRTGFVGFILFFLFLLIVVFNSIHVLFRGGNDWYEKNVAAGVVAMIPLLMFDDLEANSLPTFLFFTMVGVVHQQSRNLAFAQMPPVVATASSLTPTSPRSA